MYENNKYSLFYKAQILYEIYENIDKFEKIYFRNVQDIMMKNQYDLSMVLFHFGKAPDKFPPYIMVTYENKTIILTNEDMPYSEKERKCIESCTEKINVLLQSNQDLTLKVKEYFRKYVVNYHKKYRQITKMMSLSDEDLQASINHVVGCVRTFWKYYEKGVIVWLDENDISNSKIDFVLGEEPNLFPPTLVVDDGYSKKYLEYDQLGLKKRAEENVSVYAGDVAFDIEKYPLAVPAVKKEFEKCIERFRKSHYKTE